jgi:hypothetical protein
VSAITGLVVRIRDLAYFIPADRVGFVAPGKNVREGRLEMPRGSLPYVDAGAPDAPVPRKTAVAVRSGNGFVAIGVDHVDLAEAPIAASVRSIGEIEDILRKRAS